MRTSTILKKITLFMFLAIGLASCDEDAKEFLAKKTLTKDYVVTGVQGKSTVTISNKVSVKDILDQGDKLQDLEIIKATITLNDDFTGNSTELQPITGTLKVGTITETATLNLVVNQANEFVLESPIAFEDAIQGEEIEVVLTLTANEVLTDDQFTLTLNLDAQTLVKNI